MLSPFIWPKKKIKWSLNLLLSKFNWQQSSHNINGQGERFGGHLYLLLWCMLCWQHKLPINCNYRSCKKLTNPTYINQWFPSDFSCVIRTLSVSNKTWQNHCGSCANLISLIADMQHSRTEWAKQRGSKRSVRKRKQDNDFKKEIKRSKGVCTHKVLGNCKNII